jgi:hypothetical protein
MQMSAKLTPILEIAKAILKPAGLKGMHVNDIAEEAFRQAKNMSLSLEEFSKKLQAGLAANLKLRVQKPSFSKVKNPNGKSYKKGQYRVIIERSSPVTSLVIPPETDKAFTGAAGEFAVMSELLFWGYNSSVMTVDSGIDVIASKNGKYFHIQVKTSAEQDGGRFGFTIKNSSFQQHHDSSMFYVFVLRRNLTNIFVIIPSSHIQMWAAAGKITSGTNLSITITVDPNGKRYSLNGINIDMYVGDFGRIVV